MGRHVLERDGVDWWWREEDHHAEGSRPPHHRTLRPGAHPACGVEAPPPACARLASPAVPCAGGHASGLPTACVMAPENPLPEGQGWLLGSRAARLPCLRDDGPFSPLSLAGGVECVRLPTCMGVLLLFGGQMVRRAECDESHHDSATVGCQVNWVWLWFLFFSSCFFCLRPCLVHGSSLNDVTSHDILMTYCEDTQRIASASPSLVRCDDPVSRCVHVYIVHRVVVLSRVIA